MNLSQKWQDVTLMNSKCSEASTDSHSQLYRAVVKNLKQNRCPTHNQTYEYYYNGKVLCPECFAREIAEKDLENGVQNRKKYYSYYHLENILNHPIVLAIDEKELMTQPIELTQLTLSSYKHLFPKISHFKIQKELIDSFIKRIKSRVDQLCDKIMANFSSMEEILNKQRELKDDMKNLGMMYEEQLMEMLSEHFVQGSKDELERILLQYSHSNENPLQKIHSNLEQLMQSLPTTPVIDIKALSQIYTTVTDQKLWKPNQIVTTLTELKDRSNEVADMVVNTQHTQLQGQYILSVQESQTTLTSNGKSIGILEGQIDSLYMLPNYKLLGVNYDKLMIINYFDQLTVEEQYPIPGCTDVLPFSDHILAISNDQLININTKTKKCELLGKNYKNLKYTNKKELQFICQNQRDQAIHWKMQPTFIPAPADY